MLGSVKEIFIDLKKTLQNKLDNLQNSDTAGITLTAEEKLAMEDAARLLANIMDPSKTQMHRGDEAFLVSQFLKAVLGRMDYNYQRDTCETEIYKKEILNCSSVNVQAVGQEVDVEEKEAVPEIPK